MSKKKTKNKIDKLSVKHDFSHLVKTKTASKIVQAESEITHDSKSPQDKEIKRDLKTGIIVICVFFVAIVLLWLAFGRSGILLKLSENIKF